DCPEAADISQGKLRVSNTFNKLSWKLMLPVNLLWCSQRKKPVRNRMDAETAGHQKVALPAPRAGFFSVQSARRREMRAARMPIPCSAYREERACARATCRRA